MQQELNPAASVDWRTPRSGIQGPNRQSQQLAHLWCTATNWKNQWKEATRKPKKSHPELEQLWSEWENLNLSIQYNKFSINPSRILKSRLGQPSLSSVSSNLKGGALRILLKEYWYLFKFLNASAKKHTTPNSSGIIPLCGSWYFFPTFARNATCKWKDDVILWIWKNPGDLYNSWCSYILPNGD